MSEDKQSRRTLQQQPVRRTNAAEQQQAGSNEFQPKAAGNEQMGEGSYQGARDYQKNIKEYLEKADVQSDAEAAKPASEAEARAIEDAEREGKSHSKGER